MRHVHSGILLAGLALAAACGPGSGPERVERSVVDGVEQVVSHGPDRPLSWEFPVDAILPPQVDGQVHFVEVEPWEVAADREGRVYVLDRTGRRVLVYGPGGQVVREVGRPGEGPGELSEPMAIAVSSTGDLAVFDYGIGGFELWPASGDAPKRLRFEDTFWGPGIGLTSWGILFPSLASEDRDGRRIHLTAAGEKRTRILAEARQRTVTASFPGCGIGGIPAEPIFEPGLRWSVHGDHAVVALGTEYEIRSFAREAPDRLVRRELKPRQASRELALQEVGNGLQLTTPVRCRIGATELVEARGFASVVPAIAGLAVAPDGTVWVERGRVAGEPRLIDVLASDGSYLGTLPPGSPFPATFAGATPDYELLTVRVTDTGEREIVVHRVVR